MSRIYDEMLDRYINSTDENDEELFGSLDDEKPDETEERLIADNKVYYRSIRFKAANTCVICFIVCLVTFTGMLIFASFSDLPYTTNFFRVKGDRSDPVDMQPFEYECPDFTISAALISAEDGFVRIAVHTVNLSDNDFILSRGDISLAVAPRDGSKLWRYYYPANFRIDERLRVPPHGDTGSLIAYYRIPEADEEMIYNLVVSIYPDKDIVVLCKNDKFTPFKNNYNIDD
ncbi:MAG: hypothetical protein K6C13_02510 [Oscillospiraceae bacterium]|nr:hypothetical protein [Oscillospiraceae bacterium]